MPSWKNSFQTRGRIPVREIPETAYTSSDGRQPKRGSQPAGFRLCDSRQMSTGAAHHLDADEKGFGPSHQDRDLARARRIGFRPAPVLQAVAIAGLTATLTPFGLRRRGPRTPAGLRAVAPKSLPGTRSGDAIARSSPLRPATCFAVARHLPRKRGRKTCRGARSLVSSPARGGGGLRSSQCKRSRTEGE